MYVSSVTLVSLMHFAPYFNEQVTLDIHEQDEVSQKEYVGQIILFSFRFAAVSCKITSVSLLTSYELYLLLITVYTCTYVLFVNTSCCYSSAWCIMRLLMSYLCLCI